MATGVAISTSTNVLTIGHNLGERAKKIICYKVNPATIEDNSPVYNSEVISFIFDFDNRNGTNTTSQHFYGGTTSWYPSDESTGFSAYVEYQDITTTKTTFRNYGATGYASGNVNPTFSKNTNYFWIAFI
jgi:hypothetical protein